LVSKVTAKVGRTLLCSRYKRDQYFPEKDVRYHSHLLHSSKSHQEVLPKDMKNYQKEIPAALLTVKEIQKEIEEAKERFRRKDPVIPSLNLEDPDRSIPEQLIDNLILVKSQEKNVAMTQYYHLGELLNEGHYKLPPGQWTQEEPVMRFIAELFKGEPEVILHL
jgi:hypothetical protein